MQLQFPVYVSVAWIVCGIVHPHEDTLQHVTQSGHPFPQDGVMSAVNAVPACV